MEGSREDDVASYLVKLREEITCLEQEFSGCRRAYGNQNVWIVKPVGSSCGKDISVCGGMKQVLTDVADKGYKCVVQKYIERPLLVREGRKFDIRQWVLVTSTSPLVIYGLSEFYCRLSGKTYDLSVEGFSDPTVHLCNHAIQKETDSYDSKKNDYSSDPMYCDTMMTQQQFISDIEGKHDSCFIESHDSVVVKRIMNQIKDIAIGAVYSVRDKLNRVSVGFEWLGLDLLVTDEFDVHMVECNVTPDTSRSTPVTSRLVNAAMADLSDLLLDAREDCAGEKRATDKDIRWELWHDGSPDNSDMNRDIDTITGGRTASCSKSDSLSSDSLSVLQFARSKRDQAILGRTYEPRKKHVCDRTMAYFSDKYTHHADAGDVEGKSSEDEL